jgi:pilus assembly protein Flp/PilA
MCSANGGHKNIGENQMLLVLNLINRLVAWKEAREEEGQTLVEYALIIALVSIALVAALSLLATNIGNVFANIEAKF